MSFDFAFIQDLLQTFIEKLYVHLSSMQESKQIKICLSLFSCKILFSFLYLSYRLASDISVLFPLMSAGTQPAGSYGKTGFHMSTNFTVRPCFIPK